MHTNEHTSWNTIPLHTQQTIKKQQKEIKTQNANFRIFLIFSNQTHFIYTLTLVYWAMQFLSESQQTTTKITKESQFTISFFGYILSFWIKHISLTYILPSHTHTTLHIYTHYINLTRVPTILIFIVGTFYPSISPHHKVTIHFYTTQPKHKKTTLNDKMQCSTPTHNKTNLSYNHHQHPLSSMLQISSSMLRTISPTFKPFRFTYIPSTKQNNTNVILPPHKHKQPQSTNLSIIDSQNI